MRETSTAIQVRSGPPGVSAAVDPAIGSEGKPLQDSPPVALIARVLLPSVLVRERAEPGLVWMRGDRHDSRDGIPGKLQHAVTMGDFGTQRSLQTKRTLWLRCASSAQVVSALR